MTKSNAMYRDLFECVRRHAGTKAAGILRYMDEVHISDWSDLTRARLNEIRAGFEERLDALSTDSDVRAAIAEVLGGGGGG